MAHGGRQRGGWTTSVRELIRVRFSRLQTVVEGTATHIDQPLKEDLSQLPQMASRRSGMSASGVGWASRFSRRGLGWRENDLGPKEERNEYKMLYDLHSTQPGLNSVYSHEWQVGPLERDGFGTFGTAAQRPAISDAFRASRAAPAPARVMSSAACAAVLSEDGVNSRDAANHLEY